MKKSLNKWFFLWSCMDVRVGLWRRLSAEELMLLKCGVGEDSCKSLGLQGDPAGGEGDARGWDGWMASLTRWTWVWVNSGSLWWTGRPGVLQFIGSQRVGHNWATELTELTVLCSFMFFPNAWCQHLPSFQLSTTIRLILWNYRTTHVSALQHLSIFRK